MNKRSGLVALMAAIGDDNLKCQNLDVAAGSLKYDHKKGTTITFGTDVRLGFEGTELLGLVVWLPRDKVQAFIDKNR